VKCTPSVTELMYWVVIRGVLQRFSDAINRDVIPLDTVFFKIVISKRYSRNMFTSNNRRVISSAALIVLIGIILVISFLPVEDKHVLHTRGRFHPLGHILAFASLGYLTAMAPKAFRTRLLLIAGLFFFAFGIEMGEYLVFGGVVEWSDVLMDFAGVFLGILLALMSGATAVVSGQFRN
jgi:glycopeptide antibiotics resistance protein